LHLPQQKSFPLQKKCLWPVCWKTHQGHPVFWPILTYDVKFDFKIPVPWLHPILYYCVTCTLTLISIKPKYYCLPVTGSFSQNLLHWKYSGMQTAGSENESWTFSVHMVLWKWSSNRWTVIFCFVYIKMDPDTWR
jgi:hypothetical protein